MKRAFRSNNRGRGNNRERGNSTLEFALAFLVFFMVVYGIMEFGRVVHAYNIISGAAREGARYAMVHGSASGSVASATDVQTQVRRWVIGLDSSSVNVTTTWASGNGPGGTVRVQASYIVNPFSALILSSGMTVQSTAQTIISQ